MVCWLSKVNLWSTRVCPIGLPLTWGLGVRWGIWKMVRPERKPIKDNKSWKLYRPKSQIYKCQAEPQLIVVPYVRDYMSCPALQILLLCAVRSFSKVFKNTKNKPNSLFIGSTCFCFLIINGLFNWLWLKQPFFHFIPHPKECIGCSDAHKDGCIEINFPC